MSINTILSNGPFQLVLMQVVVTPNQGSPLILRLVFGVSKRELQKKIEKNDQLLRLFSCHDQTVNVVLNSKTYLLFSYVILHSSHCKQITQTFNIINVVNFILIFDLCRKVNLIKYSL